MSGPEGSAGNLDRILARVLCIGEDVAVRLMDRPECQAVAGAFCAEGFNVLDIEDQLDDGLPRCAIPLRPDAAGSRVDLKPKCVS